MTTHRIITALVGLFVCLSLASCSDGDGYRVVVRFDPASTAELVDRVEVAFLADCSTPPGVDDSIDAVLLLEAHRNGAVHGLGNLPEGSYGLYGRATDACGLFAMGCQTVDITADGSGELELVIEVIEESDCPPVTCETGGCPDNMSCVSDVCVCDELYIDCDGIADNGCERFGDTCSTEETCSTSSDCPDNMSCMSEECVCDDYYLDCDEDLENGCERFGLHCTTEEITCTEALECSLDCVGDADCQLGCYEQVCYEGFSELNGINTCKRVECESECSAESSRSVCYDCLGRRCAGDLEDCENTGCESG